MTEEDPEREDHIRHAFDLARRVVEDPADVLDRDQSRVSRDLRTLVDAGLVTTERVGKAKRVAASDREILLA